MFTEIYLGIILVTKIVEENDWVKIYLRSVPKINQSRVNCDILIAIYKNLR